MGSRSDEELYVQFCTRTFKDKRASCELEYAEQQEIVAATQESVRKLRAGPWYNKLNKHISRQNNALIQQQNRVLRITEQIRKIDDAVQRSHERWYSLWNVPMVRWVTFSGCSLLITTETLFGKDKSNVWHRIGPYLIVIKLDGAISEIRWMNLDGKREQFHGAANISSEGFVSCFGNAREIFTTSLASGEHVTLVEAAVRYAECTGAHDRLILWPAVSKAEVPDWYLAQFG